MDKAAQAHNQLLVYILLLSTGYILSFEWPHEKTQHFACAKIKTQISFVVTVKLISAFVFATWIAPFFFFLNPNFQASSLLQRLCMLVCVGPVQKPHCRFSYEVAHLESGLCRFLVVNTGTCNSNLDLSATYFAKTGLTMWVLNDLINNSNIFYCKLQFMIIKNMNIVITRAMASA